MHALSIQEHSEGVPMTQSARTGLPLEKPQFDNLVPAEEAHEAHQPRNESSLCETLKRLGFAHDNQVRLYGEELDLLSDPVKISDNFVFVDALERKSGQFRRVCIPRTILQIARIKGHKPQEK